MALRMLLVDDDRDVLEVAEAFLTRTDDIDVVTETDPERAVDRLDSVDCLVTDYRMPGADGIDLCRRVTGEHDLPVLVLTALDPDEVADEADAAGATEVVEKGSGSEFYDHLADRIREAVD